MTQEQLNELEKVRATHPEGILLPSAVVDAARNKASPLHSAFTWKDNEAAELWRQTEARNRIRAFITYEPRVARETRGYLSIPSDRVDGGGYRPVGSVLDRPNWVEQLVDEALVKLTNLRNIHKHLAILDPLWAQIEADVAAFRGSLTTAKAA